MYAPSSVGERWRGYESSRRPGSPLSSLAGSRTSGPSKGSDSNAVPLHAAPPLIHRDPGMRDIRLRGGGPIIHPRSGGPGTSALPPTLRLTTRSDSVYDDSEDTSLNGDSLEELDEYGRRVRQTVKSRRRESFKGILPDNPFGVRNIPFNPMGIFHDQHILQFWTWRSEFYVLPRSPTNSPGEGLIRCDIADKAGDWCGTIVLNEKWIENRAGTLLQFIAISDAKSFTKKECPNWTHYIPKDQEEVEWDLYYVLLIEQNRERLVWERIGLGKVFQAAFDVNTWDEIKLG